MQSNLEKANNCLEKISKFLQELPSGKGVDTSKGVNLIYRLSKALIFKKSKRRIKKAQSQELLTNIANEDIIIHEYTVVAMQNLCELLIDEMREEFEEEIFREILQLINKLVSPFFVL